MAAHRQHSLRATILLLVALSLPLQLHAQKDAAAIKSIVDRALKSIGLDKSGVIVDQAEWKTEAHFLPFGSAHDTILRIHVTNFKVTEKDGNRIFTNPYIHSANIYYSGSAGQVVKILSDLPRRVKVIPFPPVAAQEKAMKSQSNSYAWTPLPAPRVKLTKTLESVIRLSEAKQILIYYTLWLVPLSKIDKVPIWDVYMRGLAPTPISPPPPVGGVPSAPYQEPPLVGEDDWETPINAKNGTCYDFGTSIF